MHGRIRALAAAALMVAPVAVIPAAVSAHPRRPHRIHAAKATARPVKHVLLISVDGLHQSDLAWFVSRYPRSTLAELSSHGARYTHAHTPIPSDSFPGMVGQVTGGNPWTTGVYYDDTWNHALLAPGTTDCAHATLGTEVTYFEALDKNPLALDAGQGLSGLPDSILAMTGHPQSLINRAALPVDPTTCKPVYPHQYLRVNTVFELARAANLRTAWSDKHPAYEILSGPSGKGVQDLFTPEINSQASASGGDWTTDNALTRQYDGYKVRAVINEIHGFDHSGTQRVGTPAIFGMNFQTVSTAEKLPSGGDNAGGATPGPLLQGALKYIDAQLRSMVAALKATNTWNSTVIILSAKHGQSPQDPNKLTRIDDGAIIAALNQAWSNAGHTGTLVDFSVDDDGMYMWLSDRSQQAADFAKQFLLGYSGTGNDVQGNPKPFTQSGLSTVYAGAAAAQFFHISSGDTVGMQRVPDLVGIAQVGTVYTGGKKKIAEHGGANPQDLNVPIVVSGGAGVFSSVQNAPVETTSIAPTIAQLLGLDPQKLKAVKQEGTPVLPGA